MEHLFHAVEVEAGELGAFEHVVDVPHAVDGGVDRRERVVAAQEEFVPDAVFLEEHERMVVLQGPVVKGGAVGVDVAVLADGGDAFAFIRVAEMGEDETQFGETGGHVVEMAGEGEFEGGLGNERGAGVEEDGEAVAGGVGPEVVALAILGKETGVHGHELDAL